MRNFFNDEILINNKVGLDLYNHIKDLPIIDYHCHLNENEIKDNIHFKNITELWLKTDHYKWRVMRTTGIDEKYITGSGSDYEKFLAFATIMPKLIGNSIYYWAHLELKMIFGINEPLNKDNAEKIYNLCNDKLKNITTQSLLKKFKVEYLCTTDDPLSNLEGHGEYDGITVSPTFRPDKLFTLDEDYIKELSKASKIEINDLNSLKKALENRLDYFISKGCKISDHGMDYLPMEDHAEEIINNIFNNRKNITEEEKNMFFSHMMRFLAKMYKEKNIIMQIHFATYRNINTKCFENIGRDAGFDVFRNQVFTDRLAKFFDDLNNIDSLPKTILYTLNSNVLKEMIYVAESFRNVKIGPAWWVNDTLLGNKQHLETLAEYSTLGTFLGMLTDSRSFSSYVRFDFFRRILANLVGSYVEKGEYDYNSALKLMEDICYNNIKNFLCCEEEK